MPGQLLEVASARLILALGAPFSGIRRALACLVAAVAVAHA